MNFLTAINYLYDASGNRVGKRSFERANVQNAYPYYPQQEEFYLRDATGNILTTFMRTNSEVAANSWQTSILVGVRNSRRGTSRRISIPMRNEIGNMPIYGSDRLGIYKNTEVLKYDGSLTSLDSYSPLTATAIRHERQLNYRIFTAKRYELKELRKTRRGTSRRISIPMRYEIGNEGNVRNIFTDELLAEQFTPTTTCTNNASCTFNYTNEHIAHPVSMYNYYAFGMPRPNQIIAGTHVITNWHEENGNGYRFGFNGMEKDNEVKGVGNSLDFGARIYDSRLGRWLSLDPLQAKYPGLSAYNSFNNNPLYYIDVEGKYFTGSPNLLARLQTMYAVVCAKAKAGDKDAETIKTQMEAMDKSDVEYHFNEVRQNELPITAGGIIYYDQENNRINMDIAMDEGMPWEPNIMGDDFNGRMGHELAHGGQFEMNEIGFKQKDGEKKWVGGYSLDKMDEDKAVDIGSKINNWMGGYKTSSQIEEQKDSYKGYSTIPDSNIGSVQDYDNENKAHPTTQTMTKINYRPTEKQKMEMKPILDIKIE